LAGETSRPETAIHLLRYVLIRVMSFLALAFVAAPLGRHLCFRVLRTSMRDAKMLRFVLKAVVWLLPL
jgi:hypothetical protein